MSKYQGLKSDLDVLQTGYAPFGEAEEIALGDDDLQELDDSEDDVSPPPHQFVSGGQQSLNHSHGHGNSHGLARQAGDPDTPFGHEPGVMIQMVAETNKSRWSHIDDLDSFFTKVYEYHQKHGFTVMMLQEVLELIQFIFIIGFMVFLVEFVDYPVLFKDKTPAKYKPGDKIHLFQIIIWKSVWDMSFLTMMFIGVSIVFWLTRFMVVVYHAFQFWDIKCFYNSALKISDEDLDSITWWDVQKRLLAAQKEHLMCIHKQELSELDVYHRILRFTNYMVAMVNKNLLPLRFPIPLLGEYVLLSTGLRFNLEVLLFRSPWAPFDQWHLREEYRRVAKRKELADALANNILILGCINLILMPVILWWQICYSFFKYAEIIKREPGSLGVRKWGLYGRLYLRHLNELDHELNARLSWAYKPATYYMDIFVSPLATVIAKNIAFVAGSVLAVLILLTVWDEDVLNVEHVLTLMTILGASVAGARVFIPDENLVFCPEKTMTQVISHIHYFPVDWKEKAHTYKVMNELDLLFPYTAIYLLIEILSPIITPIILIWYLRPKSQELVDFFRNFTVDVVGVGDVCSFAQMDVRRHGHPYWQADLPDSQNQGIPEPMAKTNHYTQGEDGKTEMSLVHFALTNPGWKPPREGERYLNGLRTCAERDMQQLSVLQEDPASAQLMTSNPMFDSVTALPHNLQSSYRQHFMRSRHDHATKNTSGLGKVGAREPEVADHLGDVGQFQGGSRDMGAGSSNLLGGGIPTTSSASGFPSAASSAQESIMPHLRGGLSRHPGPLTNSSLLHSSRLLSHHQPSSLLIGGLPAPTTPSSSLLIGGLAAPPDTSSYLNSPALTGQHGQHNDIAGGEYAVADMSMSALYLHNIQHRHAASRHTVIGQTTGYRFGEGQTTEREPLLREESS